MQKTKATLTRNTRLTHNIYELVYTLESPFLQMPIAGQYAMFQLAKGLNRAYSFADFHQNGFTLLIERIPEGKWSPILCDANIGDSFDIMLPLGHFVLQDNTKSKCFIGTGTGLVPLYCQIKNHLQKYANTKICFHFGVRTEDDIFYRDRIGAFTKNPNFKWQIYLSREQKPDYEHGYVTKWITKENVDNFEEFYICGSPEMVSDARKKLQEIWVEKSRVLWEQY